MLQTPCAESDGLEPPRRVTDFTVFKTANYSFRTLQFIDATERVELSTREPKSLMLPLHYVAV